MSLGRPPAPSPESRWGLGTELAPPPKGLCTLKGDTKDRKWVTPSIMTNSQLRKKPCSSDCKDTTGVFKGPGAPAQQGANANAPILQMGPG